MSRAPESRDEKDLAGCCPQGFDDLVDLVRDATNTQDHDGLADLSESASYAAHFGLRESQSAFAANIEETAAFNAVVGILCGRPLHEDVRVAQIAAEVFAEQTSCLQKLLSDISADAMQALIAFGPKATGRLTAYIQCQFGLSAQSSKQAAQACVTKGVLGLVSGQSWKSVLLDLATCLAMTAIPGMAGNTTGSTTGETGQPPEQNPGPGYQYSTAKRC